MRARARAVCWVLHARLAAAIVGSPGARQSRTDLTPCVCSNDAKATGVAGYTGYVGPFKAHPDFVNMAEAPSGPTLWNGFPNLGLHDGSMGGYGDSGDSMVMVGGGDDVEGEPLESTAEGASPDVEAGAEEGDPEATSALSR